MHVPYLVHHFLERAARERPEHPFLVEGKASAAYADVNGAANRLARLLMSEGLRRGGRVALCAGNSRLYVEGYFGILKAGGIAVPLNTALDPSGLADRLRHSEARHAVVSARFVQAVAAASPALGLIVTDAAEITRPPGSSTRCLRLSDLAAESADLPGPVLVDLDPASIIYTSGSTGRPRGVTLSHRNLVTNVNSIVEVLGLRPDDRALAILPFYYVYGKSVLNAHTATGATVVIENRFAYPNVALDTLEAQECTSIAGVPSTFAILLNRSNLAERRLTHLRCVTQAGGPMAPEVTRRLMDALPGKRIFIMYGATEASARLTTLLPEDLERKLGSIGRPIPNVEIRLVAEDGHEAAPGEVGEIVARGSNIMLGYWNDQEETRRALSPDGYRTGDLARRDEDGFLFIQGRKNDMIKIGANRVAAKEIEDAILSFSAVHEAAVIGVKDEILGEAAKAFVVFRDAPTDVRALQQHLARHLPSYALPQSIEVRTELPKNESGKIMKRLLSDPCAASQAS